MNSCAFSNSTWPSTALELLIQYVLCNLYLPRITDDITQLQALTEIWTDKGTRLYLISQDSSFSLQFHVRSINKWYERSLLSVIHVNTQGGIKKWWECNIIMLYYLSKSVSVYKQFIKIKWEQKTFNVYTLSYIQK